MKEERDNKLRLRNCACRNLRMTTRVITQYYDRALYSSGLKAAQFALLNNISSHQGGVSVSDLADFAMMDQTTVTRNVEILRKKGYVNVEIEDTDSRKKCITVSETGKNMLASAMPLWGEAQLKIQQTIGQSRYEEFLEVLSLLQDMK